MGDAAGITDGDFVVYYNGVGIYIWCPVKYCAGIGDLELQPPSIQFTRANITDLFSGMVFLITPSDHVG